MMSVNLSDFQAPLIAITNLLDRYDQRGVIIGGIAVGLLGKPRLTVDIDVVFLLSLDDIPLLLQNAEAEGFEPRMDAVEQFARKTRVVFR